MRTKTGIRLVSATCLVIAAIILYVFYLLIASDVSFVLGPNWTDRNTFLAAVKNLVIFSPLILFIVLISIFWIKRLLKTQEAETTAIIEAPSAARSRFMTLGWVIGVLVALGFISGISVYVNPRNMYGTRFYLPWGVPDREEKVTDYLNYGKTPDVLIFGSSRAFEFSPDQITRQLGYSAFNMSLDAGLINDFWLYTNFILAQNDHKLPKLILMQIDYPFTTLPDFTAEYSPFSLLPYMDNNLRLMTIQARLDGLWDIDQFSESLFVMRFASVIGQPKGYEVMSNGWTVPTGKASPQQLQGLLTGAINTMNPHCWMTPDPVGEKMFLDYIQMAQANGTTILLLRGPYHPLYYAAMKERVQDFDRCDQIQLDYFHGLTQKYNNVLFADYENPALFSSDQSNDAWYDQMHMTVNNASILLNQLMGQIQQGYQLALKNSANLQ